MRPIQQVSDGGARLDADDNLVAEEAPGDVDQSPIDAQKLTAEPGVAESKREGSGHRFHVDHIEFHPKLF